MNGEVNSAVIPRPALAGLRGALFTHFFVLPDKAHIYVLLLRHPKQFDQHRQAKLILSRDFMKILEGWEEKYNYHIRIAWMIGAGDSFYDMVPKAGLEPAQAYTH